MTAPATTRVLVLRKTHAAEGQATWHATALVDAPLPALQEGQVVVKVHAAGFNRRDLWARYGQYPRIQFDQAMGSDAAGEVVQAYDSSDELLHKRVFLSPLRKWKDGPAPSTSHGAPEILGSGITVPAGVFAEYVVVDRAECIPTPAHLDDVHAAAWPLGGVTAWRACMVNAQVRPGHNVLITGIGGGVALLAAQLCVAAGANVYVSSGSDAKLARAAGLGVKGGVNYKSKEWPGELQKMLASSDRPYLDAVIDSGGGDILGQTTKLLKANGRLVCYGMTANPKIVFTMREVLKNLQLIGSTMGSTQDLLDATKFMTEHKLVPIVSDVLDGLEAADQGFDLMKSGDQFGKIVIRVDHAPAKQSANL